MDQIALERPSRVSLIDAPPVQNSGSWAVVYGLVAAAVVLLIAGAASQTSVSPIAHSQPPSLTSTDVAPTEGAGSTDSAATESGYRSLVGVRSGVLISSDDRAVTVQLPGVVSWVLAPHSRVLVKRRAPEGREGPQLIQSGDALVVTLEKGQLEASVVPHHSNDQLIERFAVEARGTRVAVHGTVFSVVLRDDHVAVEVTRGTVSVGPAGHRGSTTGRLLVSPAKASFGFEGKLFEGRLSQGNTDSPSNRSATSPETDSALAKSAAPNKETAASIPTPAGQPPTTSGASGSPATGPRKLNLNEARALMVRCLSSTSEQDSGTMVTVSSNVTAQVAADGVISALQFSPPLRPDLQQRCGGALFDRRLDQSGTVSFRIHFDAR